MVKAILGYDIIPGMSVDEYERWLREIHLPDLSRIPGLKKVVFNTVKGTVMGDTTFIGLRNYIMKVWMPLRKHENGGDKTRFRKKEVRRAKRISNSMSFVKVKKWSFKIDSTSF